MVVSYLVLFYRSISKHRTEFAINVVGLTTALTCSMLVYLWIDSESAIDKFLDEPTTIYQVLENTETASGIRTTRQTPQVLADRLLEEFPEITSATVATPSDWFPKFIISADETSVRSVGLFVGSSYFSTFPFALEHGVAADVLADPNSIVLSETLARNLFGDASKAVGKIIDWKIPGMQSTSTVTGVFKDVPASASEHFDFVLSFDFLREKLKLDMKAFDYGPCTYLTLRSDADVDSFNAKLVDFISKKDPSQSLRKLLVTPYSKQYLFGEYENGVQSGGRITYLRLFASIGVIVILIACVNFTNLTTAKASAQLKNIGVRKIIGASRLHLINQYFMEAVLTSFWSFLLSIAFVVMLQNPFSQLTGKNLFVSGSHFLIGFVIAMITGLIAGLYPSLYLSNIQPMSVLKGRVSVSYVQVLLRKGLVVFQFSVAIVFIISVAVVYDQVNFIQSRDLGFDKDHIIVFDPGPGNMQKVENLITDLQNVPGVVNASSMWGSLVAGSNTENVDWNGEQIPFAAMLVNYDFIETIGLKLLEGRSFSPDFGDSNAVIFNKKAIDVLGLKDAVNTTINFHGEQIRIIGIAEDFHFQSLYTEIHPLYIRLQKERSWTLVARLQPGFENQTLGRIREAFKRHNEGLSFEYHFLDLEFKRHYAAEKRVSTLLQYFSGVAMIISGLGLFGLAAFTAERKRKEIGIRKVLGASAGSIVAFISTDFFRLVWLGIFVGSPIAYWLLRSWLSNFAYHIEVKISYFIFAALASLFIAGSSVAVHALRAAATNPVKSLREN